MNRKEKIQQLRRQGLTYKSIGNLFNLTKARIHQILSGYNPRKMKYRDIIFRRDNYTCQWGEKCNGKYDGIRNRTNLIVHHIDLNDKNNNPKNLITLCHSCHAYFHSPRFFPQRITNNRKRDKTGKFLKTVEN